MTDEEALDAFLDGEMEPAESAAFEARLAAEPALRTSLEARRALDGDLKEAFAHARGSHRGRPSGEFRLPEPRNPTRLWITLPATLAAGIALGVFLRGSMPSAHYPGDPEGHPNVVALVGPAQVVAFLTQATRPLGGTLAAGSPVHEGDEIAIPADGRACLVLSDGTEVRLDRGAKLQVGERWANVRTGRVWARVTPGKPFRVTAGLAQVTVLGTELSVTHAEKSTEVQLFSGKAHVEAGGAARDLAPGQEAEFADGKLSEARRIGSEAIATGWMLELVARAGNHDRELADHLDRLLEDMGHMKAVMIEERVLVEELGGSCRVPLARYLVSDGARGDLEPRRKAARVLARIADPTVSAELARALRDPDGEVRVSVAEALQRVSKGSVCTMPEEFRGSCDDGSADAAEAWAKEHADPK